MRKYALLIFCLSSCFYIQAQSDTEQLMEALRGPTPLETDLQQLCDEVGGRVTGTEENKKAVKWAMKKFKQAKVSVEKEAFEMPIFWMENFTEGTISGDADFQVHMVSKYRTDPGKYLGKLVYLDKLEDIIALKRPKPNLKGKLLIVDMDLCLDINGLFAEYDRAARIEILANDMNAAGIVFMSTRPKKLLYRFITSTTTDPHIPQFIMAREDAQRTIRLLKEGKKLKLKANVNAKTGEEFISHNVIAEIKGSKFPDEIVVLGAHIDSWAMGTGANDNGCNVTMLIDIARQMKKLNIKPDRTIRFALWNGEEQGYFGSWHYTKRRKKELDNHVMALSVDIGSGDITGCFTNGQEALIPVLEDIFSVSHPGVEFANINAPIVGTDNFDFMLQGIPNLVANHKPQVYGINYHASSDTYDKVNIKSVKNNAAYVASLALGFANMDANKYELKRQSRAEIETMFEAFDLEFTMRMFNVWEPWVKGKRGREK